MAQERVQRKDGSFVTVIADSEDQLKEAVKAKKNENPVFDVDINRPVKEGHDLVVVHEDGSTTLSNKVPEDSLNGPAEELDQRSADVAGQLSGDSSNSASAKKAAELKADEVEGVDTDSKSSKDSKK